MHVRARGKRCIHRIAWASPLVEALQLLLLVWHILINVAVDMKNGPLSSRDENGSDTDGYY